MVSSLDDHTEPKRGPGSAIPAKKQGLRTKKWRMWLVTKIVQMRDISNVGHTRGMNRRLLQNCVIMKLLQNVGGRKHAELPLASCPHTPGRLPPIMALGSLQRFTKLC